VSTNNVVRIPFHGDEIIAIMVDGTPYISMRRACHHLGLSWPNQYRKLLEEKDKFKSCDIATLAPDGKTRTVMAMPAESFHGWLFTVNAGRLAAAWCPRIRRTRSREASARVS